MPQGGSEGFALRQEAIARVHGLGARVTGGFDDFFDLKIGLGGGSRADMNRLVRHLDMQGVPVGIRINRHRGDAHPAGGLDDAAGNFAPIGDQNFLKQIHPRGAGLGGSLFGL